MELNQSERDRITNRLEDLFGSDVDLQELAALGNLDASSSQLSQAKSISANTSDKAYRKLTSLCNITSYSKLSLLHSCPRKYELDQLKANSFEAEPKTAIVNIDFAFGHAVGAGIQTYAATKNLQSGLLAAFLAWKAPWDAEKLDGRGNPSGKNLAMAGIAVEKFGRFLLGELSDYEVVVLPNGKPAVELAFAVDMENGFFHFGHIDTVLRNKTTGKLAVWEGKTTGFEIVNEASYRNSSQALGYSVVVDAIAKQLGFPSSDYEVLYIVYSSKSREFQLLPFVKTKTMRAEWMQDLLLDHANIKQYATLGFYPKRGENCIDQYRHTCQYYGSCGMKNSSMFPTVKLVPLVKEELGNIESLDFTFTLSDLISAQE